MSDGTDWEKEIAEVFERTEADLREIGRQAMERGEYTVVERVVEAARQAARITRRDKAGTAKDPAATDRVTEPVAIPPRPRPKRKKEYPQFVRESGELVKIGWSKKNREEYEHRAKPSVREAVVGRIGELGPEGLFQVDDIDPVADSSGSEVPSYQIYVCLAWLRWTGLVIKHGRQGYSVAEPRRFPKAAAEAWDAVPRRS